MGRKAKGSTLEKLKAEIVDLVTALHYMREQLGPDPSAHSLAFSFGLALGGIERLLGHEAFNPTPTHGARRPRKKK